MALAQGSIPLELVEELLWDAVSLGELDQSSVFLSQRVDDLVQGVELLVHLELEPIDLCVNETLKDMGSVKLILGLGASAGIIATIILVIWFRNWIRHRQKDTVGNS